MQVFDSSWVQDLHSSAWTQSCCQFKREDLSLLDYHWDRRQRLGFTPWEFMAMLEPQWYRRRDEDAAGSPVAESDESSDEDDNNDTFNVRAILKRKRKPALYVPGVSALALRRGIARKWQVPLSSVHLFRRDITNFVDEDTRTVDIARAICQWEKDKANPKGDPHYR